MSVVAKALTMIRPQASARRIGPIGIDFALESIHLVQLETRADGAMHVRARASVPFECPRRELITRPHQFRTLIRRALEKDRF